MAKDASDNTIIKLDSQNGQTKKTPKATLKDKIKGVKTPAVFN
jgi:hypothetical protein